MQRRGWLIGIAAVFGFCVIACLATVVFGLPAFRGNVKDSIQEGVSTEVARQIPATPGQSAPPGDYVITAESLQQSLRENANDSSDAENVLIRITTVGIDIGITSRGQEATYSGKPAAEDGRFVIQNFETNSRFLSFIIPADDLADAIEKAVNGYLQQNNLQVQSVELTSGAMTLTTVPAT
jgi:hypothetical protein